MAARHVEIRKGAYYDSIVLMELQATLAALPGITGAGVMMGTNANKALLEQNGLLAPEAAPAQPEDLIISLAGEDEAAVHHAGEQIDTLLARQRTTTDAAYRPKSLETAAQMLPEAQWVLISVPGRYATRVAREALQLNKHVFLYSDNVALKDEVALKQEAATRGLLVMGPDCGTAIIHGVGLGFANRIRRGHIGLVGASGTGLQQVTAQIHQLGGGVTQAFGTGGRDLSRDVGGRTARQALAWLGRDTQTEVLVLLSKPPDPDVAALLIREARKTGKPVVLYFTGYAPPGLATDPFVHLASSLDDAAARAVALTGARSERPLPPSLPPAACTPEQRYVRGLFSGGTLAQETLLVLQSYLPDIASNLASGPPPSSPALVTSQGHTVLDLGADTFTVGRLHPMLDPTLRLQRLRQEAADPTVAVLLLDVVLGYGAHPDPADVLAPLLEDIYEQARHDGRTLEVVVLLVGTDEDPQSMTAQRERLQAAGVRVETRGTEAAAYVGRRLQTLNEPSPLPPVDLGDPHTPLHAINVGLESFTDSLTAQDAPVVHVDWRPPAGGKEKLLSILERMKTTPEQPR